MKKCRLSSMILLALLLTGCASVTAFKGIALDEDSVFVSGLTPVRQDKNYACGAACVAAVAIFWNVPLAEFRAKYPALPADTNGHDLELLAKEMGLQAFAYRGSMEDLQENLSKGRPVIVMIPQPLIPSGDPASALLLNAWNSCGPKPAHWVVVVGVAKNKTMIIHDPAAGPIAVKREVFQTWWAKKDNLAVLLSAQ